MLQFACAAVTWEGNAGVAWQAGLSWRAFRWAATCPSYRRNRTLPTSGVRPPGEPRPPSWWSPGTLSAGALPPHLAPLNATRHRRSGAVGYAVSAIDCAWQNKAAKTANVLTRLAAWYCPRRPSACCWRWSHRPPYFGEGGPWFSRDWSNFHNCSNSAGASPWRRCSGVRPWRRCSGVRS